MTKRYLSGNVFLKNGYWYCRFRLPTGLDSKRKIGPAWTQRGKEPAPGFHTERTATRYLETFLSQYDGWTPGSDPLFTYAAEEFIAQCRVKELSGNTVARYKGIIERYLIPNLGTRPLSSITADDIAEFRANLSSQLAPSSINQTKVVLSGIWKHAKRSRKYRGEDFSEWFDPATMTRKLDIEVYSPEEVGAICRVIERGDYREVPRRPLTTREISDRLITDAQYVAIIKTAAFAGLRMSEIRALLWKDVDFLGEKITIRRGYTDRGGDRGPKGRADRVKTRTVPMAPQVATELDKLSQRGFADQPDDLVFSSYDDGKLSSSAIYRALQNGSKAAKLRQLRFHDLRHSFGTQMIRIFNVVEVKEMMGHESLSTTMIYLHWKPRTSDAKKMGALFGATPDPVEQAIEMPR